MPPGWPGPGRLAGPPRSRKNRREGGQRQEHQRASGEAEEPADAVALVVGVDGHRRLPSGSLDVDWGWGQVVRRMGYPPTGGIPPAAAPAPPAPPAAPPPPAAGVLGAAPAPPPPWPPEPPPGPPPGPPPVGSVGGEGEAGGEGWVGNGASSSPLFCEPGCVPLLWSRDWPPDWRPPMLLKS